MITNHFFSESTLQYFGILIVQIGQETKKLWYFENDDLGLLDLSRCVIFQRLAHTPIAVENLDKNEYIDFELPLTRLEKRYTKVDPALCPPSRPSYP